MASDVAKVAPVEAPARKDKDPIASISGHISVLSNGDLALLRRIYLTKKVSADGVVVKLLAYADVPISQDPRVFGPWRLVAHAAALLAGTGKQQPHLSSKRLGSALHAAGLAENRLLRLTAARGEALQDQIVIATRFLARAGSGPVNLWTLFHLAGRDPDKAEEARLTIARDYYAADAASI